MYTSKICKPASRCGAAAGQVTDAVTAKICGCRLRRLAASAVQRAPLLPPPRALRRLQAPEVKFYPADGYWDVSPTTTLVLWVDTLVAPRSP